ncbi:hypothetical protein ACH4E7_06870 [Kitasatospora sp. NPDC018058]|uniref:hypothetical protein n=1 Tax=Kitasatospora sp. NPDC018058 TaxID=3364025 RepID=UPI0037C02588
MKLRFRRREDPEIVRLRDEYFDFARWAGVAPDRAQRLLQKTAAGRPLTIDTITHAGDILAERSGSGLLI